MNTARRNGGNLVKGILIGTGVSVIAMLALAAICAWLIISGKMNIHASNIAVDCMLFLSAMAGAAYCGRQERGVLRAALCGLSYLIILACVHALFMNSPFSGVIKGVALIGIASLLPPVLIRLPKKGKSKTKRNRRFR